MNTVKSSPHIHGPLRTDKAMLMVAIALLPAALWGVYAFGFRALFTLIVAIASSLLTEFLLGKVSHESTLRDGSALVTGLLVGMNMPPLAYHQFYIPLIASAFAITVVKWTFGGLGCNWMNPALAGRVFVFFSFTSQMSSFILPRTLSVDSLSSATPLSAMKTAMTAGAAGRSSELLALPVTEFAQNVADKLGISPYAVDAFLGNRAGCIGEVFGKYGECYRIGGDEFCVILTSHEQIADLLRQFDGLVEKRNRIPFPLRISHGWETREYPDGSAVSVNDIIELKTASDKKLYLHKSACRIS